MAEKGPSEDDLKLLELIKKEMKGKPKTPEYEEKWVRQLLQCMKSEPEEVHPSDRGTRYIPSLKREPPKISCFSGANHKNETTYDLWKYEVTSLMED